MEVNYCLWTDYTNVYTFAPMALGKNVKFLRELKNLTYEAVGSAVGTDGQNIFNLEKRDSKVSKFAPELAKFFDVDLHLLTTADLSTLSPNELAGMKEKLRLVESNGGSPASDDEPADPDEMIELLALYQQATKRGRENIIGFARGVAKRGAARWRKVSADKG